MGQPSHSHSKKMTSDGTVPALLAQEASVHAPARGEEDRRREMAAVAVLQAVWWDKSLNVYSTASLVTG